MLLDRSNVGQSGEAGGLHQPASKVINPPDLSVKGPPRWFVTRGFACTRHAQADRSHAIGYVSHEVEVTALHANGCGVLR